MPTTYDPSFRLAVTALARIEGAFVAARLARVSVNTVKTWLAADEGQDHSEAEWDAAQKLAQSRHLQALITGKPTGAGQWAMSSGISARNRRITGVQRRWDERREAQREERKPAPNPIKELLQEVLGDWITGRRRWDVQDLYGEEIDVGTLEAEREDREVGQPATPYRELFATPDRTTPPEPLRPALLAELRAELERYAALSSEEVAARFAVAKARRRELEAELYPPPPPPPTIVEPLSQRDLRAEQARDVSPDAPTTPPDAPQPQLRRLAIVGERSCIGHNRTRAVRAAGMSNSTATDGVNAHEGRGRRSGTRRKPGRGWTGEAVRGC